MYTHVHTHTHTNTHTHIRVCVRECLCVYNMYIYIYIYIRTYVHTHANTHTHTHTHTHTCVWVGLWNMSSEFYDAFRGVGPIKRFCSVMYTQTLQIHNMCHMRKGIPIMYAVCFEWKRTGSVTVESTQSWPGQILEAKLTRFLRYFVDKSRSFTVSMKE